MEEYTECELEALKEISTQKQIDILLRINEICEVKFKGKTKRE